MVVCGITHRSKCTVYTNILGARMFRFQSNSVIVHIKFTSNMAACYDNNVNDVTAPRV